MFGLMKKLMVAMAAMLGLGGCTAEEITNANAVGSGFVGLFNLAGDGVQQIIKWLTTLTFMVLICLAPGCAEKTIKATDTMMQNNITPLLSKVVESQAVKDMIVQGNAQMISPNLHIKGTAFYVQGITYDFNIGVDGVASNITATANSVNKDYNFSVVQTSQPAKQETAAEVK